MALRQVQPVEHSSAAAAVVVAVALPPAPPRTQCHINLYTSPYKITSTDQPSSSSSIRAQMPWHCCSHHCCSIGGCSIGRAPLRLSASTHLQCFILTSPISHSLKPSPFSWPFRSGESITSCSILLQKTRYEVTKKHIT